MAGMLAGVECARRRKLHQNGGWLTSSNASDNSSTRRSFLCLYTSNHEHTLSSSFSKERSAISEEYNEDDKLGEVAREAKQRLHKRLTVQLKSQNKRSTKGWRGMIC